MHSEVPSSTDILRFHRQKERLSPGLTSLCVKEELEGGA